MFRPIRRKEREIATEEAEALLRDERRGVLAVNGDEGYPYAVPVNYLYDKESQRIIFHGSRAGHKIEAIRACDKVCFTVYGHETVKKEEWAPFLQSAVIFGRCHLLEAGEKTNELLKKLAMKYYPNMQLVDDEITRSGKAVQLFVIEIEHLSGKEIQEK